MVLKNELLGKKFLDNSLHPNNYTFKKKQKLRKDLQNPYGATFPAKAGILAGSGRGALFQR